MVGERRRRCILTREAKDTACLIRFVAAPDGRLVADVAGRLPGRGMWLSASRDAVVTAAQKGLFGRAARREIRVDSGLADVVEAQLAARCLQLLGLARRAGQLVAGFEQVRNLAGAGQAAVVVVARDAAPDGRARLARLAGDAPAVSLFERAELSLALGRENVVHAALSSGGLADRFLSEAARLEGFRGPPRGAADSILSVIVD